MARKSFARITTLVAFAVLALLTLRLSMSAQVSPIEAKPGVWLAYQQNPAHNPVLPGQRMRLNWVTALGGKVNGGLAIVDGTIYADSFDHKLYALDERTGKIEWSASADDVLMSTPVLADGIVVVGGGRSGFLQPNNYLSQIWGRSQGDNLYAFDARDGHLIWRFHTAGEDMPTPAIAGGTLYFANGDAHAYAIDLHSGKERWVKPLTGVATMASAAIDRNLLIVSTCHNAPYVCETRAIDRRTGRTLWVNSNGGSDCSPAVAGGLVFVNGNRDDTVHFHTGGTDVVAAIDERSGKTRWTWTSRPGPYTFPGSNERQIAGTVANGVLYQPIGQDSRVVAFDARTGRVRWNLRTWADVKMSPIVHAGRVYFGDTGGILYDVNARNGRLLHTSSYLQPFSTSSPIIAGDTLFIADGDKIVATPLSGV